MRIRQFWWIYIFSYHCFWLQIIIQLLFKGLVEHLSTKINLIDTQSIEIIDSKLQWVLQRLNQLNEKKAIFDDNEKYTKINELYSKLIKWQDLFAIFPKLVERLTSLNELHQKALQFSTTLSRLDTENLVMKQN